MYRYERSGTMHGLFRVRGFTQDDAHIFCLPDQIEEEIVGVLDLTAELLGAFGFREYEVCGDDRCVSPPLVIVVVCCCLCESLNTFNTLCLPFHDTPP